MKTATWILFSLGLGFILIDTTTSRAGAPLAADEPLLLDKTQGRFDFLRVDSANHRLLLAHTGNKSLDVVDLNTKKLLKSVPTGAAQDSAVDAKNGRYYVAVSTPPRMAIVDSTKLEMVGEVPLKGPADLLNFNPQNGRAYICNDEVPELYVIDPNTKRIEATITFTGKGMEDLTFDERFTRLFQVVKDANVVSVVEVSSNKILESWPTMPAASPHGMALIPATDRLLVAGGNGKLVMLSSSTGKVLASADIAPRVDEMAYDPDLHMAYCASGQGQISVIKVDGETMAKHADVPSATGCHSIALDPATHTVWIAYAKGEQSYAQSFQPVK
jgi:DNA-binding beta-propeller fold protein YncE